MTRSLTAEETAALPPMALGLPVDLPLPLREVVWASAYGAAFAEQFQMAWEAADKGRFVQGAVYRVSAQAVRFKERQ